MASSGGGVPPGFRFHPTDEELLQYYLKKKVSFQKFDMEVIREVDLNKMEPWDLQERCRIGSTPQSEWYFFSHKDRKYPTGSRTNRATSAGFWKATGRDKCIRNSFKKIGMRKTLVFYRGRAPHGQKTDWIMHEYRLEDGEEPQETLTEDGWVVCRVFKKKNLFKVGNEVGSASPAASDHQLNNANISASSTHRSGAFMYRDNLSLFRQQQTNQHGFDLYKPEHHLALHYPHLPHYDSATTQAQAQAQALVSAHKPMGYDFPDSPGLMVKQLISNPRDCESGGNESLPYQGGCQHGLEEAVPGREDNLNEWAVLDRLVTPHVTGRGPEGLGSSKGVGFEDANVPHQINQLSLRAEMDFWGYGK